MEAQGEKVLELYGVLTSGDVKLLENVLRTCSLETVLQFEKTYGQTPLHLCLTLPEDVRCEAMKHLLNSDLIDPYRKNAQGETAMECAVKEELTETEPSSPLRDLIKAETSSISEEEAFVLVIRHGSILVFEEFRKLHPEVSNEKEFQCVSGALIEMNVKCIPINPKLKIYLQWLLSKHSYTAMSGDATKLNYKDWQHHIDVITKSWEDLQHHDALAQLHRPNNGMLRLIEMIHNRLYILHFYHKNAFRHLPMTEVIFSLAVYLSIFKSPSEQQVPFKMIFNKNSIMGYLRMISQQLQKIKPCLQILQTQLAQLIKQSDSSAEVEQSLESVEELLRKEVLGERYSSDQQLNIIPNKMNLLNRIRGLWKNNPKIAEDTDDCEQKALEIMFQENFIFNQLLSNNYPKLCKTIKKDYALAKQLYSVQKILRYAHNALSCKKIDYAVTVGATKKLVQVIGEAIKNTKETSNMPTKASAIVNVTLTSTFAEICKSHREFFSHGCPMSKILVDTKEDYMLFSMLLKFIESTVAMFEMLFVITTESVRQNFYGKAYRCRSISQLRELFGYVGDLRAFSAQQLTCITYVKHHIDHLLKQAISKMQKLSRDRQALSHEEDMLQTKANIVDKFHDHVRSRDHISYEDMTAACRQPEAELKTVRRLLVYNLRRQPNDVYDKIIDLWKPSGVQLSSIQWRDESAVTQPITNILKVAERRTDNIEYYEYPTIVLQWMEELKIEEKHHSKILNQLHIGKSELYRFMHDTYGVHLKWAFFERYCGKRNPKLDAMRTRDKAHLQGLFEEQLDKLRNVLSCVKIRSIEDLVEKTKDEISYVLPAIEFHMLEVCELLKSVKYFGDNTYWIRQGVPNMQGRNLRNSLAHDALSYRILTNSDEMHLFANALIMTDSKIDLFQDQKGTNELEIKTNNSYTTYQLDQQCRLLKAIREQNVKDTFDTLRAGCVVHIAQFLPKKCCRLKQNQSSQCNDCLFACKISNAVAALLDGYIEGFSRKIDSAEFHYRAAIHRADYATAFSLHTIAESASLPADELYYWPSLVDELKRDNRWPRFSSVENALDNLHQMVRCGNNRAVQEFVDSIVRRNVDSTVLSTNNQSSFKVHPLYAAIIFGMEKTINPLTDITAEAQYHEAIYYAIKLHWNSISEKLLLNVDEKKYNPCLVIALLSNNVDMVEYILEKMAVSSHSDPIVFMTARSLKLFGNVKLIRLSLKHKLASASNESFWSEVLYANIKNENWPCVRYIIESPNIAKSLNRTVLQKPMKYLTCLQLLVAKGCRKCLSLAKKSMELVQISQQYRYSDQLIHPMAIAVSQHLSNRKLLRALERIGFDYLDCSSILQTAIQVSDQPVITLIMDKLAKGACVRVVSKWMRVVSKWRTLAYLQQPTKQKATALHQAVEEVDLECVKLLLDRCRSIQILDDIGRLDWIIFRRGGATTEERFNLEEINKYGDLRKYCEEMIQNIEDADVLSTPLLAENVTGNRYEYYTPLNGDCDIPITAHFDKLACDMESYQFGDEIPDFFNDDATKAMLLTLVVETGLHTKCAVKLNNGFCVIFGLLHDVTPSNKSFVNFITANGQTPLHGCFPDATEKALKLKSRLKTNICKLKQTTDEQATENLSAKRKKEAANRDFTGDAKKILQLLCSEGANPLLMQNAMALAGIHVSFQYTADRTMALFLIDHCIENELGCRKGANLWEHDDGDGNTLLHHAIMCDRLDVMKILIEKKVKTNVQNCVGLTPAMMAVCGGLQNPTEALRCLLEADVSTLNARDAHQRTLLHYSVLRPGTNILNVLLEFSPDFTIKDRKGNTAFREALLMGHVVWMEAALNFALRKEIHVTNSIDEIFVMIVKSKFDAIVPTVAKYFYFAFDGKTRHDDEVDEEKLIADLQVHGVGRLASYLKLITVGH